MSKNDEVPAGNGRDVGLPVRVLVRGEHSGGACALFEVTLPPDGAMATHVHRREDEHLYVAEGVFAVRVGERTLTLGAGDCARLPRNVPHGFRNVGEGAGRLVLTAFPAGIEGFYDDLGALIVRIAPSVPKAAEVAAVSARYGVDFLSPLDRGGCRK